MSENLENKKAVITILGMIGSKDDDIMASYYLQGKENSKFDYFNTFPLLCDNFADEYEILPIFTQNAKEVNKKVIQKSEFKKPNSKQIAINSIENGFFIEENNYEDIFKKINDILNSKKYSEFIVDVTHGFRHLPILAMVAMMIANFKDAEKIKYIFFAKEIEKPSKQNGIKGEFEIINLKGYLDIANIAFILSVFGDNYTVSNHIKSYKFTELLKALRNFSNDLMALNVSNLQNSQQNLISELYKIDNDAIKHQAQNLMVKIQNLADFKGDKKSEILYKLACDLFDKNYLLLSLAALFESTRSFMVEFISQANSDIIKKVKVFHENEINEKKKVNFKFGGDLGYRIDSFCMDVLKFKCKYESKYERFLEFINKKNARDKLEFSTDEIDRLLQTKENLKNIDEIIKFYGILDAKRNDLAHANSSGKGFENIRSQVGQMLKKYKDLIILQQI